MLTFQKAHTAAQEGLKKAEEMGLKVAISIYDLNGVEILLLRMDGSFAVAPTFARAKALTAATLGLPTDAIGQYSAEGKPYYGIESLSGGKFTTIAGGLPLKHEEKHIGGVGVGGSSDTAEDLEIAKVVADSL